MRISVTARRVMLATLAACSAIYTVKHHNENIATEALGNAIIRNDVNAVDRYLNQGGDPNGELATKSRRPLLELIKERLSGGFNPEEGKSFLAEACDNTNLPIVKLLVKHGAETNPETRQVTEDTPLEASLHTHGDRKNGFKRIGLAYWLMTHGARANHYRIAHYDSAFSLTGKPYDVRTNEGDFVFQLTLLNLPLNFSEIPGKPNPSQYQQAINIIKSLFTHGDTINVDEALIGTSRYPTIATILLNHGANVNYQDSRGKTAIFSAIQEQDPNGVRFFLNHGASVAVKDNMGKTPMQFAISYGATPEVLNALKAHPRSHLR